MHHGRLSYRRRFIKHTLELADCVLEVLDARVVLGAAAAAVGAAGAKRAADVPRQDHDGDRSSHPHEELEHHDARVLDVELSCTPSTRASTHGSLEGQEDVQQEEAPPPGSAHDATSRDRVKELNEDVFDDEDFDSCDEAERSPTSPSRIPSEQIQEALRSVSPKATDSTEPALASSAPTENDAAEIESSSSGESGSESSVLRVHRLQREFSRSGLLRKPKLDTTLQLELELEASTLTEAREWMRRLQKEIFLARKARFRAFDRETGGRFRMVEGFGKKVG